MNIHIRLDWQGLDLNETIAFFDFFPFGVSYMGHRTTKYFYIWLIFWVIGISWARD
jgi:hypothetical protein